MNNERRAKLKKAINHLDNGLALIEEANQEEVDAFDNIPVGLQSSYSGEAMQEVINTIDDAQSVVQQTINSLTPIIEG